MLSIKGSNLAEVFGNIATDERYGENERASARKIAEHEAAFLDIDWKSANEPDFAVREKLVAARRQLIDQRPYKVLPCEIDDQRLLQCDRLVWTIRPYAAADLVLGQMMNIGVDKV